MKNNKILALKYRPQDFKDLIGQETMSQIITNGIKLGKTPNAYLLTGIRGVGKTTTARLIAKALNCTKNFSEGEKCETGENCHCKEIVDSNHMDVLEMDAASKTGIDDVRELIENSKYSPTSARYKIFIIDEVHMLSKQAFNGLLKTLEEPPPSLKFILATTEVRKIPVTILSRCQRFDLKRVSIDKISEHLKSIALKEKGKISNNALKIISHASEGSVRDAISLLDRSLIFQSVNGDKEIQEGDVRQMLGLADKSKILSLFKEILNGSEKNAVTILKELIDNGLDAKNFLNDILEILYLFSRAISLGQIEKDTLISESEASIINDYSKNIDLQDIGIFWQLTLKTLDDLKILSNEKLGLEMFITQLVHIKNFREIDDTKSSFELNESSSTDIGKNTNEIKSSEILSKKISTKTKSQMKNIDQFEPTIENPLEVLNVNKRKQIKNFKDLIYLAAQEKEVELKYDLERNVNLVSFESGKINISFNEKLSKNFIKILSEKLYFWTGERWIISLSQKEGSKTIFEERAKIKLLNIEQIKKTEKFKNFLSAFPDAKLNEISEDIDD